jgi:hypothetical protein
MDETLAKALQNLEISGPVSHGLLHIFPLQRDIHAEQDISLLKEALQARTLRIEELYEACSVPELHVVNEGNMQVLILEGDELIGGKQNCVVNSSVLVAAGSEITLPVSCIERGPWSYRSRAFSQGTGSTHLALRRLETKSVHDYLRRGSGHRRDQRAVWREVDRRARLHRAASPTLQDSRSRLSERLDAFEKLARDLPEGTCGVVVAIGERLVLLEVLAGPRTFARVFRKLLSGYAFESVGLDRPYGTPDPPAVRSFIEAAAKGAHEEHQAVGAGRDVRFEKGGISGYALIGEEGVLHAAALAA